MKLLPNEEILITSNEDKIILTDHRIQMNESSWGQNFTISIFLENISSMEIKYRSNILLLVFGVISVLGGFYFGSQIYGNNALIVGIALGVLFFIIWWLTRKHIISISSNGGSSLNFMVQGMDEKKINDFIHKISLAKLKRVNQLAKL